MQNSRLGMCCEICTLVNTTGPHRWEVNIVSGNGLVPPGTKPLPDPMLNQIYGATRPHWVKDLVSPKTYSQPKVEAVLHDMKWKYLFSLTEIQQVQAWVYIEFQPKTYICISPWTKNLFQKTCESREQANTEAKTQHKYP